jgi:hypothetical protein
MKHPFNTVRWKPLIGPVNPVASADELPPGVFSWKENLEISKTNRLARRSGWQDFLRAQGGAPLANVRHLDEVVTTDGVRRLVAATSGGEVYLLGATNVTWTQFTEDFGTKNEWTSDALGNVLVMSNGEGLVRYAVLPTSNFLDPIEELDTDYSGTTIGASAAKVIVQFSGVMFIMNYSEGGVPLPWRVRWSALNAPISYVDSVSTIAGFQDLPWTQKIINAKVLENRMLIYTDTSIWQCRATGGDDVFNFTELYTDPDARSRCLSHKRSLVAAGSSHIYAGQDGIYSFSNYQRQPERLGWLDDAARLMFEPGTKYTLDRSVCDLVAGFNSDKQEVWFSWTGQGGDSYTLVADTLHQTSDIILKGWHAFVQHSRSGEQSFGDWLDQYIPNDSELWFDFTNSNYTELCGKVSDDFCLGCDDAPLFIGALKEDEEVKTIGVDVSGERIPGHSTGGYVEGFKSILRGVVPVGNEDHDKVLRKVKVEIYSRINQAANVRLQLRTGLSNQAFNPNDDDRDYDGIAWSTHPLRFVGPDPVPATGKTMDELAAVNKLRVIPIEWNVFARSPFIYWELSVVDVDGNGTALPGALEFSRLEFEVQGLPRR